jgi:hypothetical protein
MKHLGLVAARIAHGGFARWVIAFIMVGVTRQVLADNPGEFRSPCQYRGDGGVYRWSVKLDSESPPRSIDINRQLVPSQLFNWAGGRGTILSRTPRQGRENEWIQLTGKVMAVIVEGDGDIHIELMDATGTRGSKVAVEIPAGQRWCPFRQTVFEWTRVSFPFVTARQELTLTRHPVVRVVGKAFWDGQHAPRATSTGATRLNRRTYDSTCSVWEVHPVMKFEIVQP